MNSNPPKVLESETFIDVHIQNNGYGQKKIYKIMEDVNNEISQWDILLIF